MSIEDILDVGWGCIEDYLLYPILHYIEEHRSAYEYVIGFVPLSILTAWSIYAGAYGISTVLAVMLSVVFLGSTQIASRKIPFMTRLETPCAFLTHYLFNTEVVLVLIIGVLVGIVVAALAVLVLLSLLAGLIWFTYHLLIGDSWAIATFVPAVLLSALGYVFYPLWKEGKGQRAERRKLSQNARRKPSVWKRRKESCFLNRPLLDLMIGK